MAITHLYVSAVVDEGNPNEVGPSEWNDSHVIADSTILTAHIADSQVTPAKLSFDPATQAELNAHEAAGDPHPGYRLESADHTHESTGLQAGKLDHGLALNGLTDDDHTQYALLAGRAGGQTIIGGTAAADDLTLRATSGVGAGSEWIIFQTRSNGSVENMRLGTNGTSPILLFNESAPQSLGTFSGAMIECHMGTNANFAIVEGSTFTGGIAGSVAFQAYNDTASANTPLDFRSSYNRFTGTIGINASPSYPLHISVTSLGNLQSVVQIEGTHVNNGGDMYDLNFAPGIQPSADTGNCIGIFTHPVMQPTTGIDITNAYGILARAETSSATGGTVTSHYAGFFDAFYTGLKPTNSVGVQIGNMGSASVTNAVGLHVVAQSGATNNFCARLEGELSLNDGIAAPDTEAGWARIYVDTGDGDLKVKFGDGTVKIITTDTAGPDYTVTNPTVDRAFDAGGDTLAATRNVLGTLINDLITLGILT